MNLPRISWLRPTGRAAAGAGEPQRASRTVGLLGVAPEDPWMLIRLLFETDTDGVAPLQPDEDAEHFVREARTAPATAGVGLPSRLRGLHIPARGRPGRSHVWALLPAGGPRNDPDGVSWQRRADVAIVAWPWRRIGDDTRDARIRLSGAAGVARRVGRLRRAAVLVTDVPAPCAPRHASQATLLFPADRPANEHLDGRLVAAERSPGDPLADPVWRETLRTVRADRELMGFVESLRRGIGRDVPMWFAAEGARVSPGFGGWLEWIERAQSPRPTRGGRAAGGLLAAAAGLLVLCILALSQLPVGGAEARWTPGATASEHRRRLERAHERYRRPGLAAWGWGAASASADVERALAIAEDRVWHETRIARIRHAVAVALAGLDSAQVVERRRRAAALGQVVAEQLRDRAGRPRRREDAPRLSRSRSQWDRSLARAVVVSSMLSLEPRNAGFGGWRLPDSVRTRRAADLRRVATGSTVATWDALLATAPAAEFYAAVVSAATAGPPAFRDLEAAAPRVRGEEVRSEPGLRAAALHERAMQARQLSANPALAKFLLSASAVATGSGVAVLDDGPMVVTFRVPGAVHWHLDVTVPGVGAVLVSPPLDALPEAGATFVIPRGHLGMTLSMRVNRHDTYHVSASRFEPCDGSDGVEFELEPEGVVAAYRGAFFLTYEARALGGAITGAGVTP